MRKVDVRWIRLHYAYPRVFPDELIDVMATEPKIAKYLDMPLQHASDKLLRSMKRGRDSEFLEARCSRSSARASPGSADAHLAHRRAAGRDRGGLRAAQGVRARRSASSGWACSSTRTKRAPPPTTWPDKVPQKIIERRWREVMAIQKRINREQNKELMGKRLEVLVEGPSPETEHLLVGRHEGQAPEIDGQVYINDGIGLPGRVRHRRGDRGPRLRPGGTVVDRPERRTVASA